MHGEKLIVLLVLISTGLLASSFVSTSELDDLVAHEHDDPYDGYEATEVLNKSPVSCHQDMVLNR